MKCYRSLFAVSTIAGMLAMPQAYAADPTAVNVTVYKSEACTSATSCVTILNNSSGVSADLVSGNGAFGNSPSVPAGTYEKLRLTLKNQISVTGDGDGAGTSCTSGTKTFLIDSSQAPSAQVTVAFATADSAPAGSTGWYANGSESHPLLMSNPVTVQANGTTNVNVSFNTAGTLSCVGGSNVLSPPTFSVTSYVQPTTTSSFTGGDYWFFSDHAHPPYLSAVSAISAMSMDIDGNGTPDWPPTSYTAGQQILPASVNGASVYQALLNSSDGPSYQAQIRAYTNRSLQWGGKVRISAPDSTGTGTISIIRNAGEVRIAPMFGQDSYSAAASADGTATAVGTYHIDGHNRLLLYVNGSTPLHGAISQDFKTILVGSVGDGIGINALLKVDPTVTGTSSLPTHGLWNEYSVRVIRDDSGPNNGENGDEALRMQFYNSVGVIDTTTLTGYLTLQTLGVGQTINNPQNTPTATSNPFTASAANDDNWQQIPISGLGLNLANGADYLTIMSNAGVDTSWIASNGSLSIISDAVKYDPRDTGTSTTLTGNTDHNGTAYSGEDSTNVLNYAHSTGFGIMSATAASGTITQSSVAGSYYMASMWDETSGTTNSQFGASDGEATLNSDGTGSFTGRDVNNLNQISTNSGTFTWQIVSGCLGVNNNGTPTNSSDDVRLNFTSTASTCTAAGGYMIDVIMVTSNGQQVGALIPSADGYTMSFLDPNSLDASNYSRRQLGLMVKLQ